MSLAGLTLSAATLGVAVVGTLLALRAPGGAVQRWALASVFSLVGFLASGPVIFAFFESAYSLCMPLMLPALMSLPPILGIYTRELTEFVGDASSASKRFSFIPALLGLALSLGFWVLSPAERETMLILGELPSGWYPSALALGVFVLLIAWCLWSLRDLAAIFDLLVRHGRRLKDLYSNIATRQLTWLGAFVVMLTGAWLAVVVSLLLDNLVEIRLFSAEAILAGGLLLLIFLASWALRAPTPAEVPAVDTEVSRVETSEQSDTKYARSALSAEQAKRLASKIESAMANDAVYLDPNLSLSKLSKLIGTSANFVSQTLNEQIGESFFDYVNRWRVNAAIPRILDGRDSVLEIAMAVGFNSRSTFYKAFQRVTGSSPRKYRDSQMSLKAQEARIRSRSSASRPSG